MNVQEIKGDNYTVRYHADSLVEFLGELALSGPKGYAPINNLLKEIADDHPKEITIDFRELAFINSSGINMLFKFAMWLRKKKEIQLIILGSYDMSWQEKSLENFRKFMPTLRLEVQ